LVTYLGVGHPYTATVTGRFAIMPVIVK